MMPLRPRRGGGEQPPPHATTGRPGGPRPLWRLRSRAPLGTSGRIGPGLEAPWRMRSRGPLDTSDHAGRGLGAPWRLRSPDPLDTSDHAGRGPGAIWRLRSRDPLDTSDHGGRGLGALWRMRSRGPLDTSGRLGHGRARALPPALPRVCLPIRHAPLAAHLGRSLLLLLLLARPVAAEPHVLVDGPAGDRTLRLRFLAQNDGAAPLDGAFAALVPSRDGEGRALVGLLSSHPGAVDRDGQGNVVATVRVGTVPPHGRVPVTLTATLGIAPPKPGADADAAADPGIPDVAALAREVRRATPAATAAAAYDLVRARIAPAPWRSAPPDAAGALARGDGDCSDMAAALVALCHAAGVPARYVGGWRVEGSAVLDPARYHNWAEVDTGRGFAPMDPHAGERAPSPASCVVAATGTAPGAALDGSPRFRALTPGLRVRAVAPKDAR